MAAKRILVTGASGFVGSHLVEHLLELGHDVFGTTFSQSDWLNQTIGKDHVRQVDLTKESEVSALVEELKPDWIFHLAALAAVGDSFGNALEVMENNTRVQFAMLEAVRQHSPKSRILCVGSATEYGPMPGQSGENLDETAPLSPKIPNAVSKMTQDYH
jgi:GDP-4-dehydro-6-deoxy-D-mannose reductase